MLTLAFLTSVLSAATAADLPTDVMAAAARALLAKHAGTVPTVCVSIDGRDPNAAIQASLREFDTWLPYSQCRYVPVAERRNAVQTLDGRPAEFLGLSGLITAGPTHATVKYAWRAGSWTGHGGVLVLDLVDTTWQVDTSKPRYEWEE